MDFPPTICRTRILLVPRLGTGISYLGSCSWRVRVVFCDFLSSQRLCKPLLARNAGFSEPQRGAESVRSADADCGAKEKNPLVPPASHANSGSAARAFSPSTLRTGSGFIHKPPFDDQPSLLDFDRDAPSYLESRSFKPPSVDAKLRHQSHAFPVKPGYGQFSVRSGHFCFTGKAVARGGRPRDRRKVAAGSGRS